MRDDRERLLDMLEAIERIEKYAGRGIAAFQKDELIQTWIVHHLQIFGEAAAKIEQTTREMNVDIPWPQVVAMQNVLVHEYFGIDLGEVWRVVEHDLPKIKSGVVSLLHRMSPPQDQ